MRFFGLRPRMTNPFSAGRHDDKESHACTRLPGRCGEPRPGPGLALAWFTVSGAEGSTPLFAPVTAIWLLAVPLVDTRHPTPDTMACSGRRLLNGTSPFKADRKHLHHILIDLGLPVARGNGGGADSRLRLNGGGSTAARSCSVGSARRDGSGAWPTK